MPYVDTGAYWNANPISKRKAPKIEIKKGLDPVLYGGYDSKSAAYFFIYEVRDKKTKPVLKMAMMPVYKMKELESDPVAFEDYCRELVSGTSCVFTRIVVPRLLKWQLVEIAGSRLCVNAEEEMKSASQLAFSQEELLKISRVCREGFLMRIRTCSFIGLSLARWRNLNAPCWRVIWALKISMRRLARSAWHSKKTY